MRKSALANPAIPSMRLTPRLLFLAIFLACAALIGTAVYMQEQMGLEPCPMCILQRYAFVAIGLVALVAVLHGPRAGVALKIYASAVVLFALVGGGTAIRQSWLQHNPPKSQSCGAELEFLLDNFPLAQALPKIFAGSGDCAAVKWRFPRPFDSRMGAGVVRDLRRGGDLDRVLSQPAR
jgi:disulfide bond formation protein DsbB